MADNGLKDLMRSFDRIPKEVRKDIVPAIDHGADEMVARMKYLAPVEKGDLQKSIAKEDTGAPLSVRISAGGTLTTRKIGGRTYDRGIKVGTGDNGKGRTKDAGGEHVTYDYALGAEYGTVDMAKQPFFWPSVNTLKRRVRRRIDRAARKAIERVWK